MKVEELASDLFDGCPRYLTQERFAELAKLEDQKKLLARWIADGSLPSRRFGRHRLIDMQTLLQRINQARGTQG